MNQYKISLAPLKSHQIPPFLTTSLWTPARILHCWHQQWWNWLSRNLCTTHNKKKTTTRSYINTTLTRLCISSTTTLQDLWDYFYQGWPILEPATNHHKVFFTNAPVDHASFFQDIKFSYRVNWLKVAYTQYDKNSEFGLITATFPHASIQSTTWVLRYILAPAMKKMT